MWIDAHAHLNSFSPTELKKHLEEAKINEIRYILNTSTNLTDASKVLEQCKENDILFGAVGISPFDSVNIPLRWKEELRKLCNEPLVIGVGEIGLDNSNPAYPDLDSQRKIFETQLDIAKEIDLPVIIHSRGIERVTFDICRSKGIKKAMFHCFTGNKYDAKTIVDEGYYISFSGIITFRNSNLVEVVKSIPLERILIETDSPYLTPEPYRGKINHPALVKFVGKKIAEILCIGEDILQENIEKNFKDLFKKITLSLKSF